MRISATLKRPATVSSALGAGVTNHMTTTAILNQSASIHPSPGEPERVFFHLPHTAMQRTPSDQSVIQVQLVDNDPSLQSASCEPPTNDTINRSDQNITSASSLNLTGLVDGGEEMILTAATLGSHRVPSTSTANLSSPIITTVSFCWQHVLGKSVVWSRSIRDRLCLHLDSFNE